MITQGKKQSMPLLFCFIKKIIILPLGKETDVLKIKSTNI